MAFLELNAQEITNDTSSFSPQEIWEAGLPYIQNFTPDDYHFGPQNWSSIEGNDGLIYVGNGNGLMEFDGNTWKTILLPNKGKVNALAKSKKGIIYVSGYGEFGYLKKDLKGNTQYHSLSKKLNKEYSKFGNIWSIVAIDDLVIFACYNFLFKWDGKEFKVWKPKHRFQDVYAVRDKVYTIDPDQGILELKGDKLKLIPNGKYFNNLKGRIAVMQPYQENKILFGLPSEGLFIYDGKNIEPVEDNIQKIFQENQIYSGTKLSNNQFAIATINAGVFVIDILENRIIKRYGKEQGLVSDVLHHVSYASDGSIWVSSDKGISRINLSSKTRIFNETIGLSEWVRSAIYDGKTLVAGSKGLYMLKKKQLGNGYFETYMKPIRGIEQTVSKIIQVSNHKLVLQGPITFDLNEENQVKRIKRGEVLRTGVKSKVYHNIVYVASQLGNLYQFNLLGNKWEYKIIFSNESDIVQVVEEPNGDLWLSTRHRGVFFLDKKNNNSSVYQEFIAKKLDTLSGLPAMSQNSISSFDDKIYAINESYGLFKYMKSTQKFVKDTLFMNQYDNDISNFGFLEPNLGGGAWQMIISNNTFKIFEHKDGIIEELLDYRLFSDSPSYNISSIDSSIVLFTGPKGIIAYNQAIKRPKVNLYPVQIRKVLSKNDSLVYAGKGGGMGRQFDYNINSMRFEYSLPYYTKPDKNQFQYKLEGFDKDWSSWSLETQKDYTNLPEGHYNFKVRGKNIFDEISKEDSYNFSVLAPWYRTWWAYLFYSLAAIATISIFSKWRSRQLTLKNLALEKLVDDRTLEIKEKNVQLKGQTQQLQSQTKRLKELDTMKTRLFANISHEFRTPLTLIKGPIEKLEEEEKNTISSTNIKMIRRNSNRLLNLVNQLLDLSKLDSGKLQLNAAEGDIYKCLRAAASSFSSHAAQRNIDYQIKIPSRPLWTTFDRDRLEKITYNLLSNAFKFTPDEGKIIIAIAYRSNRLQIVVKDSGYGIQKEKLPYIFDRFYQVDDSYTKEKSGSGIGLALTKELVELMQGEIYIETEVEKGTTFKVILNVEEIKSHQQINDEENEYEMVHENVAETVSLVKSSVKKDSTILIIEDNNDMRHFIKEQLQNEYEIIEAVNGSEGLKNAIKTIPDLIITDLMMPKMDGITLCKKLKTNIDTSHIPVIMLTAKAGIENKLEGLETGADDYLTKPFNAKELQVRVKNLIRERKKLRKLFGQKVTIDPSEVTVTSLDQQFLKDTLQLLEDQHPNSEFGVPQMQKELGMSKTQLHCKLKALTDHPPGELLRNFRLKRAAQLLTQKGENISQVAYSVGFNSLSYFTRCFKEFYKMAPSEYIQKNSSET